MAPDTPKITHQIAHSVQEVDSGLDDKGFWFHYPVEGDFCVPRHIQTTSVVDPTLLPNVYKEQIDQGVQLAHHLNLVPKIKERIKIYLHTPMRFIQQSLTKQREIFTLLDNVAT